MKQMPWSRSQKPARVTAETLRAAGRREVQTELGSVMVGRPGYADVKEIQRLVRELVGVGTDWEIADGAMAAVERNPSAGGALFERVLLAGVISPRLGTDPEKGPTPRDFSFKDQAVLVLAILALCKRPS